MAVYKVETNKRVEDYHWQNTWWVDTGTTSDLPIAMNLILEAETSIHLTRVLIIDATANLSPASGFTPVIIPYNMFGTRTESSTPLKPEQVLRVQYPTDSYPAEKDFRYVLLEGDVSIYIVDPTLVSFVTSAMGTLYESLPEDTFLTSSAASITTGAVVDRYVQNLQLHRKRKRLTPPAE